MSSFEIGPSSRLSAFEGTSKQKSLYLVCSLTAIDQLVVQAERDEKRMGGKWSLRSNVVKMIFWGLYLIVKVSEVQNIKNPKDRWSCYTDHCWFFYFWHSRKDWFIYFSSDILSCVGVVGRIVNIFVVLSLFCSLFGPYHQGEIEWIRCCLRCWLWCWCWLRRIGWSVGSVLFLCFRFFGCLIVWGKLDGTSIRIMCILNHLWFQLS